MADVIRRDPYMPFAVGNGLRQAMEHFFDDPFFRGTSGAPFGRLLSDEGTLAVDVSHDGKDVVVKADLPGFAKDEIEVEMHEGVLSIKAAKAAESEEKTEQFYRRERSWGAVSRRIALPGLVKDSPVEANLKDGVLTLRIAVPEREGPKQIEINAA